MKKILLNPSFSLPKKNRNLLSTVAGLVGILGCFSISFSTTTGYASLDPTLSEPLIKLGTLPPEDADGPLRYWSNHKKYFLVIAVNQTDVPETDLPFAQVDGHRIVDNLKKLGYKPLDPAHPILTGPQATASAIMAVIDEARRKEEEASLVVYYTGHGAVGPKDLWLQTAGQVKVGDGQGVKFSDLIVQARHTTTGKGFEGNLVLILDACYSGTGTVSQGLTLGDLGPHTTILTSSADIQESFSLDHPEYPKMSAFTYALLQGMGADWGQADGDGDGILRWEELKQHTIRQLRDLYDRKALSQPMTPNMLTNHSEGFLAYQRKQVRVWRSSYRANLTTKEMNDILAAHLQTLGATPKEKPELPKDAQALAKGLDPEPEDYYAKAIQATSEGRLQEARALFVKADQQSRTREQAEETRRQEALTQQQEAEAAKQAEQDKRYDLYLARARMETYDGKFTEAFTWYQKTADLRPPEATALINEFGLAGLRAGKYPQAEPYLQQALQQREQDLDPKHPDIGMSLNNLAALYDAQGKYAEAEPLYQRALRITETALGTDHPSVAIRLNNLAELYRTQGKYAEAEPLYQRALRINEDALGPDHPQVAPNLNNLALLYKTQGKYAEAEPLYQRALRITETALGTDHPSVAIRLNNLAALYDAQGKYAEAEPLYQRALRIDEAALGATHPDVAIDLNNLAALYDAQGKYAEAEPLYQRALRITETALGTDHPSVAIRLNNLAELYRTQGKYAEAEPLYQRALRIDEAALGATHPDVAIDLNNLALLYKTQGKYAEAEPLYQRALRINEDALGPDHPQVAPNLNNLAALYDAQGKYAEAEPLYQRALRIDEAALGATHPDVAIDLNNLAELYRTQGKYAEAEPLYQRSFIILMRRLGPDHPNVATVFGNYQEFLKTSGQASDEDAVIRKLQQAINAESTSTAGP